MDNKTTNNPAAAQAPVAHVPVHPRLGPLWTDTLPVGADFTRAKSYPMMPLYAAPVAAAPAVDALRMALQHVRLCAPDATVEAALEAALASTPAAPGIDPDVLEKAAIELWHRWGNDSVIEWEDETHKAEYRLAAEAVLALLVASPKGGSDDAGMAAEYRRWINFYHAGGAGAFGYEDFLKQEQATSAEVVE